MIRVLVVADTDAGRAALEALLRPDARFEVVEQPPSRGGGTSLGGSGSRPDVILTDAIRAETGRARFGGAPVVMLVDELSRTEIRSALRNGVRAVLSRRASPREIVSAVEAAAAGLSIIDQQHLDALLPTPQPLEPSRHGGIAERLLTARESDVLGLMAQGVGNKAIAQRLGVSEHTVKFHVSSILAKLDAESRTEAVSEAIRRGLVVL